MLHIQKWQSYLGRQQRSVNLNFRINMNKLYYHSNEFFLLRDYPENKNYINGRSQSDMASLMDGEYEKYQAALKACIAAKTRIDNPEIMEIGNLLSPFTHLFNESKDGIFDLPENVEFEEREIPLPEQFASYPNQCETVLRLKLKEEVTYGAVIIPHFFSKRNAIISRAMTYLSEEDGIGKEIFDELSTLLERK